MPNMLAGSQVAVKQLDSMRYFGHVLRLVAEMQVFYICVSTYLGVPTISHCYYPLLVAGKSCEPMSLLQQSTCNLRWNSQGEESPVAERRAPKALRASLLWRGLGCRACRTAHQARQPWPRICGAFSTGLSILHLLTPHRMDRLGRYFRFLVRPEGWCAE